MPVTCPDLAVPMTIMQHVVNVESSGNPYAIGVVKGRLARQPRNLKEAVATAQMLENKGFNFSVGIAQVNRYNLKAYGLYSYEHAFQLCPNLQAGTKILKECYDRSQHWGKAFSCYYSGNFVTGYKHGYVQKVTASMQRTKPAQTMDNSNVIAVIPNKKIPTPTKPNKSRSVLQNKTLNQTQQNNLATRDIQLNSSYINKKAGTVEVPPQVYTDSAFVF